MQAQQHDDLSTMPAANLKSGRVQTMYEGNDPEEQNNNTPEETSEINEMEVLLRESATPITIKRGDVVEGVIVRIDQDEILVDIGLKSEGVLSTKELPANGYGSFNELHIDDKILVYVMQPETPDGHALLSLKRAHAERQWRVRAHLSNPQSPARRGRCWWRKPGDSSQAGEHEGQRTPAQDHRDQPHAQSPHPLRAPGSARMAPAAARRVAR